MKKKHQQEELPEMPSLPAEGSHAFTCSATFKKANMGMKSEAAMMELQFSAFAKGLDHEAIANLLGKSVTLRVCSVDFARQLHWLGKEDDDRQRRAETAAKEDAAVESQSGDIILLTIGDYKDGQGNRWTVKPVDGGFKIEPDGEFDISSLDLDLNVYLEEDVARGMLQVWCEKRGYTMVPPVGYGAAYKSKAKDMGIIRLAWNNSTDAFQPFFFTKDDTHEERGFIGKLAGGWGNGHAEDAQQALDDYAKAHELDVAGYYELSLIVPNEPDETAEPTQMVYTDADENFYFVASVEEEGGKVFRAVKVAKGANSSEPLAFVSGHETDLEFVEEALAKYAASQNWTAQSVMASILMKMIDLKDMMVGAAVGISLRDENGVVYSVEQSPTGQCFCIVGRKECEPDTYITLTDEEGKTVESATEKLMQIGEESKWTVIEEVSEPVALEPAEEDDGGDQAEEDSGESTEEAGPIQTAESEAEPELNSEDEKPQDLTCDRQCKSCEQECESRTEEYDPFAPIPEHPESPNAEHESGDDNKTTMQKLQEAFANGAKRGGPKIRIKEEFKVAGAKVGPINVFEVLNDGKAADVMGKGPIDGEIINREWEFVE